jgi:cobalamin synthase
LPFRLEYLLDLPFSGENTMRAFILACLVAGIIAGGAAAILDNFVQEPVSVAFAEPGTRN